MPKPPRDPSRKSSCAGDDTICAQGIRTFSGFTFKYFCTKRIVKVVLCECDLPEIPAVAKCAPGDAFDFEHGFNIAAERVLHKLRVAALRSRDAAVGSIIAQSRVLFDKINAACGVVSRNIAHIAGAQMSSEEGVNTQSVSKDAMIPAMRYEMVKGEVS